MSVVIVIITIINEYYYSAIESKKSLRALNNRKNNTNDGVMHVKNVSQDCPRSNERQKSCVFSCHLKAISNGDVMTSDGRPFQTRAAEIATVGVTCSLTNGWSKV